MPNLIGGLLRFWPQASPLKEQLFLQELVVLLAIAVKHPESKRSKWEPVLKGPKFRAVVMKAFHLVLRTMTSTHHQVAERAVLVWREDCVKKLIDIVDSDKIDFWPDLYTALKDNQLNYWLPNVRNLCKTVLNEMKSRDAMAFAECEELYKYSKRKDTIGLELDQEDGKEKEKEDGPSTGEHSRSPPTDDKVITPGMTGAPGYRSRRSGPRKSKWESILEVANANSEKYGWEAEGIKEPFDGAPVIKVEAPPVPPVLPVPRV
jgi:hypothetical protein